MVKLSVFVACPYTLFPLPDYKKAFEAVAKAYPVTFTFADERITNQQILAKISNYIREHDISLFDITGWNPNVALELGIAVGMNRKYFILLNTYIDNREAPSDIRGIERIHYASNQELEAKVSILLSQELPNKQDRSESAFDSIKDNIARVLADNKGIGIGRIAELTQQDKAIVQSVVRAMVQSGGLKTTGAKKGTVYYPPDTDLRTVRRGPNSNQELKAKVSILLSQELPNKQDRSESAFDSIRDNIKDNIARVLADNKGIGLGRIAELTQQDKAIIQSVVKAMVQSGDLKTTGAKKGTVYYPPDTDLRTVRRGPK